MKLYGLILTYNSENCLQKAIDNIPFDKFYKIICSDDASSDNTKEIAKKNKIDFFTHEHFGYGGNLFYGLEKAFSLDATHVVEIHGDGQYDLKNIDQIYNLFYKDKSDLILGNRFYSYIKTFKSGMPFHIFIGNIVLSYISRIGFTYKLRDFFPGLRAYSKTFFEKIKYHKLPSGYEFSLEVIILSLLYKLKINSVECDCNYNEIKTTAPISYLPKLIYYLIVKIFFYKINKKKLLMKSIND
jgi:glycosyltransferase involved in cell wall biosynthesis